MAVPTHLVASQRRPVEVRRQTFQLRWVLLGACMLLGLMVILITAAGLLAAQWVNEYDPGAAGDPTLVRLVRVVPLAVAGAILASFWVFGIVLSVVAASRRIAEAVWSVGAVLLLLGVAALPLSGDLAWLVVILALPSLVSAGIGAWIGGWFPRAKG